MSFRRRLAVGSATLVALASLVPLSASAQSTAASSPASTPTASPTSSPTASPTSSPTASPTGTPTLPGVVSNVTTALSGALVNAGDYVSSGWAISMAGKHPAATVDVTSIVAKIPLQCQISGKKPQVLNLVIHLPHSKLTIPADDTAWHPTSGAADPTGYEAKILVGALCQGGTLETHGKATYTAKLISTDTKDPFAIRFHSVDARTNVPKSPNTDCTSLSQNKKRLAQCKAPWTPQTRSYAAAPATTSGGGTGTGTGTGTGKGTGIGTGTGTGTGTGAGTGTGTGTGTGGVTGVLGGVTGTVAGLVGNIVTPPPVVKHILHLALHTAGAGSAASAHGTGSTSAQPGGVSGATIQPAPVLILPAPSQSAVLGPVPLPVPVIGSVAAGVGGALPWKWFLLLAILDLGLIVGIVIRRRAAQHNRLNAR